MDIKLEDPESFRERVSESPEKQMEIIRNLGIPCRSKNRFDEEQGSIKLIGEERKIFKKMVKEPFMGV